MTTEQVLKAQELSEEIDNMSRCIYYLEEEDRRQHLFNDYMFKRVCYIAKDEVLPIFEKKLQELKNELAEL